VVKNMTFNKVMILVTRIIAIENTFSIMSDMFYHLPISIGNQQFAIINQLIPICFSTELWLRNNVSLYLCFEAYSCRVLDNV